MLRPLTTPIQREEYTYGGAVTGSRKYYGALGQTIALKKQPASGPGQPTGRNGN